MGSWTAGITPPGSGSFALLFQLLTDGSVLFGPWFEPATGTAKNYRLVPDANGSYKNGTFVAASYSPVVHYGYCTSVANDGRVILHGSEFYSGQGITEVYDPVANVWTTIPGIASHEPVIVLDDGRHYTPRPDASRFLTADSLTYSPTGSAAFTPTESGMCLLPDGRVLLVHASDGSASSSIYQPSDDTWTGVNYSAWLATHAASWKQKVTRKFVSDGTINYELGSLAWMPKIGKAVLIGGQGDIFTFDPSAPSGQEWAVEAALPMETDFTVPPTFNGKVSSIGRIRSSDNGLTGVQIKARGNITLDLLDSVEVLSAPSSGSGGFYIELSNGHWIRFTYTSVTKAFDNTSVTFVGLDYSGNAGDDTASVTTGDKCCLGRPTYACLDAPTAILPGGHILFAAGIEQGWGGNGGFNQGVKMFSWSGSGAPVDALGDPSVVGESVLRLVLLPSGEVMDNLGRVYTPSGAEATPDSSWKPGITSFPGAVSPDAVYDLTGTQLTGLHEGGFFGDDGSNRTNFPIVKFISRSDGHVYFARTYGYTYRGIEPGRSSQCKVKVPSGIPFGTYDMTVTTNGIQSDAQLVNVTTMAVTGGGRITTQGRKRELQGSLAVTGGGHSSLTGGAVVAGTMPVRGGGAVYMQLYRRRFDVSTGGATTFQPTTGYGVGAYGDASYGGVGTGKAIRRGTFLVTGGGRTPFIPKAIGRFDVSGGGATPMTGVNVSVQSVATMFVYQDGRFVERPLLIRSASSWTSIAVQDFLRWDEPTQSWLPVRSAFVGDPLRIHGGGHVNTQGHRVLTATWPLVTASGATRFTTKQKHIGQFLIHGGGSTAATGGKAITYGTGQYGGGTYGVPRTHPTILASAGGSLTLTSRKVARGQSVISTCGGQAMWTSKAARRGSFGSTAGGHCIMTGQKVGQYGDHQYGTGTYSRA